MKFSSGFPKYRIKPIIGPWGGFCSLTQGYGCYKRLSLLSGENRVLRLYYGYMGSVSSSNTDEDVLLTCSPVKLDQVKVN